MAPTGTSQVLLIYSILNINNKLDNIEPDEEYPPQLKRITSPHHHACWC